MHKPTELGSNSQHLNSWLRQVGRERIGERARRDCNRGITSSRILIATERRQALATTFSLSATRRFSLSLAALLLREPCSSR